mmetsp:Transcript_8132/g.16889  ORF Transcript_8132/g.16889 Transcript_8132/m.16889 type:complete len:333 (+) Transcript_8132:238-1236(+)
MESSEGAAEAKQPRFSCNDTARKDRNLAPFFRNVRAIGRARAANTSGSNNQINSKIITDLRRDGVCNNNAGTRSGDKTGLRQHPRTPRQDPGRFVSLRVSDEARGARRRRLETSEKRLRRPDRVVRRTEFSVQRSGAGPSHRPENTPVSLSELASEPVCYSICQAVPRVFVAHECLGDVGGRDVADGRMRGQRHRDRRQDTEGPGPAGETVPVPGRIGLRQRLRQQLQDPDAEFFPGGHGPAPDDDTRLRDPRVPVRFRTETRGAGRARCEEHAVPLEVPDRRIDEEMAQRQQQRQQHSCLGSRRCRRQRFRVATGRRQQQPMRLHGELRRR